MSDRMTLSWQRHPELLVSSIDTWWGTVQVGIVDTLHTIGDDALVFARSAHAWVNRTGDAERGLTVTVEQRGDAYVLILAHTVFYGVFLELKWGGVWGVIPGTLTAFYGPTMSAIRALLR